MTSSNDRLLTLIRQRNYHSSENPKEESSQAVDKRWDRHEGELLRWLGAAGATFAHLDKVVLSLNQMVGTPDQIPDTFYKALRQQNPPFEHLDNGEIFRQFMSMSETERLSLVDDAKGLFFELDTVEKLNEGTEIGTFVLEPGQWAGLAPREGLPRILIHDADGEVASALSTSCSEQVRAVTEALEHYPDIGEVAVTDSGLMESGIELFEGLDHLGGVAEVLDILEPLGFIAPGLPLIYVGIKHGRTIICRPSALSETWKVAKPDLIEAGTFSALAALLVALDAGLVTLPVLIVTKRISGNVKSKEFLAMMLEELTGALTEIFIESPRYSIAAQ